MRGCKVTLFEKSGKIGGNFGTIASVGFKHRIRDLIWWYNNQLNKLGVDLRLNTEITADDPILGSADAIFLATGSVPLVPPIPGADLPNVMTVLDYHRHGTDGQNIVICGGGLSGCDAAIELHGEGKNVSIIEMQDDIAKDAQFINSITIHELMKEYGIALHTSQRVVGIEPDGVRVVNVNDGHRVQDRRRYGPRCLRPEVQHRSCGQDLRQVSYQVQLHRRLQPGRQIRQGHP